MLPLPPAVRPCRPGGGADTRARRFCVPCPRARDAGPTPPVRSWRFLSPILVTSSAQGCYVRPGCFEATCYPILSPLLPARMSPGMQLTAEVPAWLSSVLRIVVRYANNNVILGNTVVTKHERWGRTWPRLHGVGSGADAEETEGECQRRKGGHRASARSPDAPWCRDWLRLGCRVWSPAAARPHKEIDEI